nr:uncharacterized protein LOC120362698 [Saimiri boliviensis boliviensis]
MGLPDTGLARRKFPVGRGAQRLREENGGTWGSGRRQLQGSHAHPGVDQVHVGRACCGCHLHRAAWPGCQQLQWPHSLGQGHHLRAPLVHPTVWSPTPMGFGQELGMEPRPPGLEREESEDLGVLAPAVGTGEEDRRTACPRESGTCASQGPSPFAGRAAAGPGPIALSPVLEPVADLREREAGERGQAALLVRRRVAVAAVAGLERGTGALLEAVDCLLAVPDGLGQWELLAQSILVHCAQSAAAGPLGLVVARAQSSAYSPRWKATRARARSTGSLPRRRSAGGSAPRKRLKRPAWPAWSSASQTHATCSGEKRRPVGGSAAASGGNPGTPGDPGPSAPAAASPAPAPAAAAASPSAACKVCRSWRASSSSSSVAVAATASPPAAGPTLGSAGKGLSFHIGTTQKVMGRPGGLRARSLRSETALLHASVSRVLCRPPHSPSRPALRPSEFPAPQGGRVWPGGGAGNGPESLQQLFLSLRPQSGCAWRTQAQWKEDGRARYSPSPLLFDARSHSWATAGRGRRLRVARSPSPIGRTPKPRPVAFPPPRLIRPLRVPLAPLKPLAASTRLRIGQLRSLLPTTQRKPWTQGFWANRGPFIREGREWGPRWGETINTEECRGLSASKTWIGVLGVLQPVSESKDEVNKYPNHQGRWSRLGLREQRT